MDDERQFLERAAAQGVTGAAERLLAAQRRTLTWIDADYLLRYVRLCDEVSGSPGYLTVGHYARYGERLPSDRLKDSIVPPVFPRTRPVEEVEADLKKLNEEFEGRVSGSHVIRREIATLVAFREGVDVATWSHSTLGCMPSEDYGRDPNVVNFVGEDSKMIDTPWTKLMERAEAVDRDCDRQWALKDEAKKCVRNGCEKKVLPEGFRYAPYCGRDCYETGWEPMEETQQ